MKKGWIPGSSLYDDGIDAGAGDGSRMMVAMVVVVVATVVMMVVMENGMGWNGTAQVY